MRARNHLIGGLAPGSRVRGHELHPANEHRLSISVPQTAVPKVHGCSSVRTVHEQLACHSPTVKVHDTVVPAEDCSLPKSLRSSVHGIGRLFVPLRPIESDEKRVDISRRQVRVMIHIRHELRFYILLPQTSQVCQVFSLTLAIATICVLGCVLAAGTTTPKSILRLARETTIKRSSVFVTVSGDVLPCKAKETPTTEKFRKRVAYHAQWTTTQSARTTQIDQSNSNVASTPKTLIR
mmetsp:Transcript_29687/g.78751  ORF Transcript_29687/g.78751 Transcript_29687/m.78751 type:complete len:237 (+) Transcript_29687:1114-1824(+)